jgi:hypothetical protein
MKRRLPKLILIMIGLLLVYYYFNFPNEDKVELPANIEYGTTSSIKIKTEVTIIGEDFYINGEPTLKGRIWNGYRIEGLLPNSRMVNGIFDDLNTETINLWKYHDTGEWDPNRNTEEFLKNMPVWKAHGLLSFNINFQGGSPQGYSKNQPWYNSAFDENGELRPAYMERLKLILDKADELGMVPNLGLFYFGQDQRLKDEKAVLNAVDNAMEWLFQNGYRNILIEVANECNNSAYDHDIIRANRVHELIDRIKSKEKNGFRFLVSVSYNGGDLPSSLVIEKSDYIILHGNGVSDPNRIVQMVESVIKSEGYTPKPIYFNEDDHFDFDKESNNFIAATSMHASWGYFDYRMKDEPYEEGYQSIPVDWGINSERKKGFFSLLKEITGGLEN